MSSSVNTTGASFLIEALMGWTSQPEEEAMPNFGMLSLTQTTHPNKSSKMLYSNTGIRASETEEMEKEDKTNTKENILKPESSDKRESLDSNRVSQSEAREPAITQAKKKNLTSSQFKQTNIYSQNEEKSNLLEKPNQSYIALISKAILSTPEKRLQLSDIYQWIMDTYPYYQNQDKSWRNSVRHNLSLNECFIKAGRSDNGKGHYWTVHPANIEAFSCGDYQRRKTRRRIRRVSYVLGCPPHLSISNLPCANQRFCIWCSSLQVYSSLNQMWPLVENIQHQSQRPFAIPFLWPWRQLPPYL